MVRGMEADLLPVAREMGMGVIPWSPLNGGWLTGRYRKGSEPPERHRAGMMGGAMEARTKVEGHEDKLDAAEALAQLAEEHDMSLIHMALAFTLAHPAVTAPIIGPRTMDHLESQIGAADVTLSKAMLDRIDEIVPPGVTMDPSDISSTAPAIADPALRRRPEGLA